VDASDPAVPGGQCWQAGRVAKGRSRGRPSRSAGRTPSRTHSPQFVVAGNGRRLVGAYIDGLVGAAIGFGVLRATFGSLTHRGLVARGLGLLVTAGYWVPSAAVWGRTVGKLVAGTRVALVDDAAAVPGWRRATVRWAVPSVLGLVALAVFSALSLPTGGPLLTPALAAALYVVVYGPILTNPLRQGLHDRAAGTVVVRD